MGNQQSKLTRRLPTKAAVVHIGSDRNNSSNSASSSNCLTSSGNLSVQRRSRRCRFDLTVRVLRSASLLVRDFEPDHVLQAFLSEDAERIKAILSVAIAEAVEVAESKSGVFADIFGGPPPATAGLALLARAAAAPARAREDRNKATVAKCFRRWYKESAIRKAINEARAIEEHNRAIDEKNASLLSEKILRHDKRIHSYNPEWYAEARPVHSLQSSSSATAASLSVSVDRYLNMQIQTALRKLLNEDRARQILTEYSILEWHSRACLEITPAAVQELGSDAGYILALRNEIDSLASFLSLLTEANADNELKSHCRVVLDRLLTNVDESGKQLGFPCVDAFRSIALSSKKWFSVPSKGETQFLLPLQSQHTALLNFCHCFISSRCCHCHPEVKGVKE